MKNIYSCHELDENALKEACFFKADTIITNTISAKKIPSSITIIDTNTYRVKGSWHIYNMNKELILSLKQKIKKLFIYKGYDLTSSFFKFAYWANLKRGYLDYVLSLFDGDKRVKKVNCYDINTFWGYLSYFRFLACSFGKSKKAKEKFSGINFQGKHIFLFQGERDYFIWKNLLKRFSPDEFIMYFPFYYSHKLEQRLRKYNAVIIRGQKQRINIPFFNILSLSQKELYLLNVIFHGLSDIQQIIDEIDYFARQGIKSIIINEGENVAFGHALCKISEKYDIKVFNTINGIKAGTANNAHTEFYKWFVWDKNMKRLLCEECFLPENQFEVVGHLAEDWIASWQYSGSLDFNYNTLKDKKIISFFSTQDLRKDKVDSLNILYDFADSREDIVILYRPHPAEKKIFYKYPASHQNIHFIPIAYDNENSKQTLYDQLLISDVSIVLASTVALESKWFNTPCITYEQKEKSLLYCVDGEMIQHIENSEDLLDYLRKFKKKKKQKYTENKNVAAKYAQIIKKL